MFNQRCAEKLQDINTPVLNMGISTSEVTRTKQGYFLFTTPKRGKEKEAFQSLMNEIERVRRFGFTQSELEREIRETLRFYEKLLKNKDKISNDQWAKILGDHFLKGIPVMPIEDEVNYYKEVLSKTNASSLTNFTTIFNSPLNTVFLLNGPEQGVNYPSKKELLEISKKAKQSQLTAYSDASSEKEKPLISEMLKPVGYKLEKTDKILGTKHYRLENGAKIILLPNDENKEQILMSGYSFGGSSLVKKEDLPSLDLANQLSKISGLGSFDAKGLNKKLEGINASCSVNISSLTEDVDGVSTPKDFEIMLKLLYLSFEKPQFDKKAFDRKMERWRSSLINVDKNNVKAFRDTISMLRANYHPRIIPFGKRYLDLLSFDKAITIYKDRIKDASDFTFVFVGNIKIDKDLPLIAKYIGNIKSYGRKEIFKDNNIQPRKGKQLQVFQKNMEVPKSSIYYNISGKGKHSIKNKTLLSVVAQLLDKAFLENLREKEGGTYGVNVTQSFVKFPKERFQLSASFECDPDKQERLRSLMKAEIKNLIKCGISVEELEKIKKSFIKSRKGVEKRNGFLLSSIAANEMYGNSFSPVSAKKYIKQIECISQKEVHRFIKKIFKNADEIEVVMNPE